MTKWQVKNLIMKELSYVVHMDLNVFGTLVLNYTAGNVDGTLIVAPKSCRLILIKTKLYEKLLNQKKTSQLSLIMPWYSESIEERVITCCFFSGPSHWT